MLNVPLIVLHAILHPDNYQVRSLNRDCRDVDPLPDCSSSHQQPEVPFFKGVQNPEPALLRLSCVQGCRLEALLPSLGRKIVCNLSFGNHNYGVRIPLLHYFADVFGQHTVLLSCLLLGVARVVNNNDLLHRPRLHFVLGRRLLLRLLLLLLLLRLLLLLLRLLLLLLRLLLWLLLVLLLRSSSCCRLGFLLLCSGARSILCCISLCGDSFSGWRCRLGIFCGLRRL